MTDRPDDPDERERLRQQEQDELDRLERQRHDDDERERRPDGPSRSPTHAAEAVEVKRTSAGTQRSTPPQHRPPGQPLVDGLPPRRADVTLGDAAHRSYVKAGLLAAAGVAIAAVSIVASIGREGADVGSATRGTDARIAPSPTRLPSTAGEARADAAPERAVDAVTRGPSPEAAKSAAQGPVPKPLAAAADREPVDIAPEQAPHVVEARFTAIEDRIAALEAARAASVPADGAAAPSSTRAAPRRAVPRPRRADADATRAVAAPAPAASTGALAGASLLAVDSWDGRLSVVVGSGATGDRRVVFVREGDEVAGAVLQRADAARQRATFVAGGQETVLVRGD